MQVRVGINAPRSIRVLRRELLALEGNGKFIEGRADTARLSRALPTPDGEGSVTNTPSPETDSPRPGGERL